MKEENIPIELEISEASPFGFEAEVIKKKHKPTPAEEQMMNNLIDEKKYISEVEFKKIQNETLTKELAMVKQHSFKLKLENEKLQSQLEDLEK